MMLFPTESDILWDITYNFSHYFTKIKVDSEDSLPTEKILTLHVIIHIKLALNKDKNHYY